jgi:hypothetical protein
MSVPGSGFGFVEESCFCAKVKRGAPGSSTPQRISFARPGLAAHFRARVSASNIEKESRKIKEEQVLGEKVGHLF